MVPVPLLINMPKFRLNNTQSQPIAFRKLNRKNFVEFVICNSDSIKYDGQCPAKKSYEPQFYKQASIQTRKQTVDIFHQIAMNKC